MQVSESAFFTLELVYVMQTSFDTSAISDSNDRIWQRGSCTHFQVVQQGSPDAAYAAAPGATASARSHQNSTLSKQGECPLGSPGLFPSFLPLPFSSCQLTKFYLALNLKFRRSTNHQELNGVLVQDSQGLQNQKFLRQKKEGGRAFSVRSRLVWTVFQVLE